MVKLIEGERVGKFGKLAVGCSASVFVVLHFLAEPLDRELRSSDETTEAKYYSQVETEGLDMGELDYQRVEDGFTAQKSTTIR